MKRGYFEIGIYHTKTEANVGTLWRSAYQLGAAGIFTIGRRYKKQSSDTCKSYANIPLRHYEDFDDFQEHRPLDALLVGIEMGGHVLANYVHPRSCIYILGAEDAGLPQSIIDKCNQLVSIESVNINSYNVAVAGSIVMYHRMILGA
jgi:tRNA G18 (ribose-2'-O)-methylase SpoU